MTSGRAVEIMASHEGVVGMAFAQVAEVSPDWAPKSCQFGPLALDFSRTFARDKILKFC